MANRYTKALKQIKDKTLDEKLQLLSEIPTNNASGLYQDVPGEFETPDPVQLLPRGADLSQDGDGEEGYNGRDTTGLFLDDGTILLEEPIGDRSYILGPMMSMWYAWANYTQIGYVRQSDRKMVNLGRIVGEMSAWDGVSGFTSYGQLTLEQAVWFKEQSRSDYRAFYPGPPSNPADPYGRYLGSMIDTPKPTSRQGPDYWDPGTQRGPDPTDVFGLMMDYVNQLNKTLSQSINNMIDMFGDTNAAAANAEHNIGSEIPSVRNVHPDAIDGYFNQNLLGRGLRSATDQLRYSGDTMYQGNPAGRSPGLSNYWSPDPATAGTYSNPGAGKGVPGAKPNPTGTITTAQRPPNTPRVTRSPLGQPQFKFPKGSPPPGKMLTQMADSAAVSAGRKAAATTAGKTLGRAVPLVSIGIAAADAGVRASKGDYAGAVLSGISAVPGPIGWAALGVQIATDAVGVTGVSEEQEFNNYDDYLENARKIVKKNGIKIDSNAMLDLFLRGLSKESKLSNQDKEFLVAIFTDAEGLEKDDVVSFVEKIREKLANGEPVKENVHSIIQRNLHEQSAGSGGGTITAHTDAGDVTINIPSNQQLQQLIPPQQGMQTTPESGVATDYSKNQLRILKGQKSEYFVSGWIKGTAKGPNGPAELEKMFAGTTVSWYQVVRMTDEITEIEKAEDEAYVRWTEIGDEVFPQIDSLLARMRSINVDSYAVFYGQYMPLSRQVDALFARWDQAMELCMSLSKQKFEMSGRLGRYVQSGKLVDPDPFKLNDPTIKKEKELDEKEISDLVNQLKKENSELKQRILLNKLKAFGYGALLLAGAVVGFKLLTGGAALKALGAPIVNLMKKLAPKVKPIKTPKPTSAMDDALDKLLKDLPISNKPIRTSAQERILDAFYKVVGDPKTLTRASDAVSRAPSGFKNDVAIDVMVLGKKLRLKAADILRNKGFQVNSHQPSGKLLTESQKRVIRNIKKPVQVKEIPTKVKVSPKLRNKNKTVGADMMKTPNTPDQFKPPAPNIWASKDRKANIRASQEKKNEVLELVGAAEHHWTYLTEQKRREHQAKVNEMMSAEFDKQMELLYEKYKAKESKLDRTISAFRKPTDVAPEYPKTPPPEMDPETGMHPKYGKKYKHDKLDPHSAEAMPPTGDPVIDANIKRATDAKAKARKLKILMGKTKRG